MLRPSTVHANAASAPVGGGGGGVWNPCWVMASRSGGIGHRERGVEPRREVEAAGAVGKLYTVLCT